MKIYRQRYVGPSVTISLPGTDVLCPTTAQIDRIIAVSDTNQGMEITLHGTGRHPIIRVPAYMREQLLARGPVPGKYLILAPNTMHVADNLDGYNQMRTPLPGYATPGMMAKMRMVLKAPGCSRDRETDLVRLNQIQKVSAIQDVKDMVMVSLIGTNPFIMPREWLDWPDEVVNNDTDYCMLVDCTGRISIVRTSEWHRSLKPNALIRYYDPNPDANFGLDWALSMVRDNQPVRNIDWPLTASDVKTTEALLRVQPARSGWVPGTRQIDEPSDAEGSWNWACRQLMLGKTVTETATMTYLFKVGEAFMDQTGSFVVKIPDRWIRSMNWREATGATLPI